MRPQNAGLRRIGRLALFVTTLLVVVGVNRAALAATDVSFDSFVCALPTVEGYLEAASEVTTSCDVTVRRTGFAAPTERRVRIYIRIDAKEPGFLGLPVTVDSRVVDSFTVYSLMPGTVAASRVVTVTDRDVLTGEPMDGWLAEQFMLGRTLVYSVEADPADAIAETDETNNTLSMLALVFDFELVPLTGDLSFGPVPMTLTSGAAVRDATGCPGAAWALSAAEGGAPQDVRRHRERDGGRRGPDHGRRRKGHHPRHGREPRRSAGGRLRHPHHRGREARQARDCAPAAPLLPPARRRCATARR
jgi:hypothetical protein